VIDQYREIEFYIVSVNVVKDSAVTEQICGSECEDTFNKRAERGF
jgi:hypothetical protein